MAIITGGELTVGETLSVEAGSTLSVAGGAASIVGELNVGAEQTKVHLLPGRRGLLDADIGFVSPDGYAVNTTQPRGAIAQPATASRSSGGNEPCRCPRAKAHADPPSSPAAAGPKHRAHPAPFLGIRGGW